VAQRSPGILNGGKARFFTDQSPDTYISLWLTGIVTASIPNADLYLYHNPQGLSIYPIPCHINLLYDMLWHSLYLPYPPPWIQESGTRLSYWAYIRTSVINISFHCPPCAVHYVAYHDRKFVSPPDAFSSKVSLTRYNNKMNSKWVIYVINPGIQRGR